MGHAVILLHNNSIQRLILECDGFALAAVENDLLRGRFLHLKTGGRGNLGNGVLAGIQPLALLMELDFTVGVRQDIPFRRSFSCQEQKRSRHIDAPTPAGAFLSLGVLVWLSMYRLKSRIQFAH